MFRKVSITWVISSVAKAKLRLYCHKQGFKQVHNWYDRHPLRLICTVPFGRMQPPYDTPTTLFRPRLSQGLKACFKILQHFSCRTRVVKEVAFSKIVPSGSETPNSRELVSAGEVSVPVGLGTSLVSRRDDSGKSCRKNIILRLNSLFRTNTCAWLCA